MITGSMDLKLHKGKAPYWLMQRMKKLAREISKAIIELHGETRFLKLLSDPLWFQSFGNVLGFDWHSSGLTTVVISSLKELNNSEFDIKIAGGKGKASTIGKEIEELSEKNNANFEKIKYVSRISAKVDNILLQDNFDLYIHSIIFNKKHWTVIQQGKNESYSRRYHWLDNAITIEPHSGIISNRIFNFLNLSAKENKIHQKASVDLIKDKPEHLYKYFKQKQTTLFEFNQYKMPGRHQILDIDLDKRTKDILNKAYEYQPKDYKELLLIKGMGKKTIRSLALISEIINSKPLTYKNPVKYSFAQGGKDGTPFEINRKNYDKSIEILREGINKLNIKEREKVIKRLERLVK